MSITITAARIYGLLDEIRALVAEIESKSETLPFAYHVERQAALATQAFETVLVYLDNDSISKTDMDAGMDALMILREISKITTIPTVFRPKTFVECWLALNSNLTFPASELQREFLRMQTNAKVSRIILEHSPDVALCNNFECLRNLPSTMHATNYLYVVLQYLPEVPTALLQLVNEHQHLNLVRHLIETRKINPFEFSHCIYAACQYFPKIINMFLDRSTG